MKPMAFTVEGDAGTKLSAMHYAAAARTTKNPLFVFAHGAGAGQSSPFVTRYANALAERGVDVVTFNFPYMEAGRRSPDRAPVLEVAFRHVVAAAAARAPGSALFIGGKSMGGRIATHVGADMSAWPASAPGLAGVVVFGYPLNPPGGPSKRSPDRVSHLFKIAAPTLIVQGTRDTFGGPDQIDAALVAAPHAISVFGVEGADHSLGTRSKTTASQIDEMVWDKIVDWMAR